MDARIGKLVREGKEIFYAFVGTAREYIEGDLSTVETALGLPVSAPASAPATTAKAAPRGKVFNVLLTFQYPAWDEKDGIAYPDIEADSKSDANSIARRLARDDGHLMTGKGRATFTATEQ